MTDALVGVVTSAVDDMEGAIAQIEVVAQRQIGIIMDLVPGRPELTDPVVANIKKDQDTVRAVLTAVHLTRGVPPQTLEVVAGLGEVWSAQTLASYIKSTGAEADWVDARDVLIVADTAATAGLGEKGMAMDTIGVFWNETAEKLQAWWTRSFGDVAPSPSAAISAPVLIITGFVCSTPSGSPTTLKRSGSDYSATIFAKVLGASRVTMWKNVDGVYTADPRRVPAAFPVPTMTFDEAMELAYFGGQVLHPSAMVPCIENRIPVYVRNVFNPTFPGTRVYGRGDDRGRWADQEDDEDDLQIPVKGVTSIEKVALVTVSGASFLGTPGVARRMMEALGNMNVNVILASQGSSEHSITVAVDEKDQHRALDGVRHAFEIEIAQNEETEVNLIKEMSIIAVIGEGMRKRPGIGGRFFNALGRAKVNVVAIAQGSSERNISVVVPRDDLSRALRAAHAGFTLSDMTVAVGIIGTGMIGTELIRQLARFQEGPDRNSQLPAMAEVKRLKIEVRGVCDKDRMILAEKGMPLQRFARGAEGTDQGLFEPDMFEIPKVEAAAKESGKSLEAVLRASEDSVEDAEYEMGDTNLKSFTDFMDTKRFPHRVLIDCTASDEVADMYPEWLKNGIHVISPNKMACAGKFERYKACLKELSLSQVQWHYESTVCGQMPVITMIRDILQTGDHVTQVQGLFSGTLSYIFNTLARTPDRAFSEVVAGAREKGLMEPDMSQDLSGADMARKAVIVARELGLKIELSDVKVESLVPGDIRAGMRDNAKDYDACLADLREHVDGDMKNKIDEAVARNERLHYVGEVDVAAGTVSVGLRSLPTDHPLGNGQEADMAFVCTTERYPASTPLVVRGPGAGAVVTSSGVFADLLRLSKSLGE
jgi:aspartokinase/homoserine dehydrogenase 1